MNRRLLLLGTVLSSFWLFGFDAGSCLGITINNETPSDDDTVSNCWQHDEAGCVADAACVAIYATPVQADGAADEAPCFSPDDCGRPAPLPATFDHCEPKPQACGPVCEIYCEFGNVLDESGCPTCSCNPGPIDDCSRLDEAACLETRGCHPTYEGTAEICGCPACFGPDCPPCDCAGGQVFQGCVADGACEGLSEEACNADPACLAEYGSPPDDGSAGAPCAPEFCDPVVTYLGCHLRPQAGCFSDFDCGPGFRCDVSGGEDRRPPPDDCTCACDVNSPDCDCGCPGAMPAHEGVCVPVEPPPGCYSDADCGEGFRCDVSGTSPGAPDDCACLCDPASDPNCGPCDCGGGGGGAAPPAPAGICVPVEPNPSCRSDFECPQPDAIGCYGACVDGACVVHCEPPPQACQGDADCPNGYCELGPTCAGLDCPPPAGQCVFPSCDEGSEVLCDTEPPTCPEGTTLTGRGGCWACVDARSCEPELCPQVVTYAAEPETGACMAFATPCDVPEGWAPCER